MTTRRCFIFTAVLLLLVPLSSRAQNTQSPSTSKDETGNRQVIGSFSENKIRFTSLGDLIQLRLEVFGPAGEVLFDSQFKPGNVVDWPASDVKGQQPGDGTYLCVVSVKDATGGIVRKQAIATVRDQSVSLRETDKSLLSSAQSASVMTGEDVNVTGVEAGAAATAILAHDGATAHLVSGLGGLSISSGDFFANKLIEQIRITAEGNVGIGVANPQARLEVAGRIKATEGIVFPDGSVQFSAARRTLGAASLKGGDSQDVMAQGASPDTSGTGTTGKISKWLDGPNGVLNDSNITEATGAIGINGTPDTRFRLDVNGSTRIRGSNPGFNLEGLRSAGNIWLFQTVDDDGRFRLFSQDNVNPGVERFNISLSTGNVGIGTPAPSQRLHVVGNGLFSGNLTVNGTLNATLPSDSANYIQNTTSQQGANFNISGNGTADIFNAATQFNIGGNRILSNGGPGNLFGGVGAGAANTGTQNSFFGSNAGNVNVNGSSNAFFGSNAGSRNKGGSNNTFFGRSAGEFNEFESGNTFIGSLAGFDNGDGDTSTTANFNTFIGHSAGISNSKGATNVFVGKDAGSSNVNGNSNTALGASANFGFTNLLNATAIGSLAQVTQSNSLVLGSINGVNNATADTNIGIGTTAPSQRLHVVGNGLFTGNLTVNGTLNATLPAGSANYIQNTTTQQQAPVSFNIDGSGTLSNTLNANIVNATTQFNIGGFPALRAQFASGNTVVGINTGQGGSRNSFLGSSIGLLNTGSDNSFFGASAGHSNTAGVLNSFFGSGAGNSNTGGGENSFFGYAAGSSNSTASGNSFFGRSAGQLNTQGFSNTFLGGGAGFENTFGDNNTFVGSLAGDTNTTGRLNTIIGTLADVGSNNLVNATAIGARAFVTQDNSLVLGSINGFNNGFDTNVGIGTTAPVARLQIVNSSPDASSNTAVFSAPNIGPSFSHIHFGATGDWYIRSAATAGKVVLQDSGGNVGIGTNMPNDKLEVNGIIRVQSLGPSVGTVPICRNSSSQISTCQSSSLRYKTDVNPFTGGLDIVNRLRPISFKWKQDGSNDIGFGAEDVARVEPLFTFNNEKGQIEGVKYDRLSVVLVNAVREQQAQILDLQNKLKQQRLLNEIELRRINATLAKLVRLNRAKNPRRRSFPHVANPR